MGLARGVSGMGTVVGGVCALYRAASRAGSPEALLAKEKWSVVLLLLYLPCRGEQRDSTDCPRGVSQGRLCLQAEMQRKQSLFPLACPQLQADLQTYPPRSSQRASGSDPGGEVTTEHNREVALAQI